MKKEQIKRAGARSNSDSIIGEVIRTVFFKPSKHQQVKKHLLDGWSLTGIQAMDVFNLYRLSSIINRLRNEGLSISTTLYKGYAIYRLNK